MNRTKIQIKRAFLKKEQSLEQIHYWIICAFAVFGYCYYSFLEPETIGRDNRYFWYVFLLPTVIGMLILGYYRREFLVRRFAMNKGFILWTFMIVFYFLQGVIFSYLTFGQLAKVSWDYLNYKSAMDHSTEMIVCDVGRFW